MTTLTQPDLHEAERNVLFYGAEEASLNDLLAVIINTTNRDLVNELAGYNPYDLINMTTYEFLDIDGIDEPTAIKLEAVMGLAKQLYKKPSFDRYQITSSISAMKYFERLLHEQQESFACLFLDTKSYIIGQKLVFIGGGRHISLSPRDILREAIKKNATRIIVGHQHPSGDGTPSEADTLFTERLVQAGNLIDIELLDHIVVGRERTYSYQEEGYLTKY